MRGMHDHPEARAGPALAHADPARARRRSLALAIPGELDADAAELVGVDLLPGGPTTIALCTPVMRRLRRLDRRAGTAASAKLRCPARATRRRARRRGRTRSRGVSCRRRGRVAGAPHREDRARRRSRQRWSRTATCRFGPRIAVEVHRRDLGRPVLSSQRATPRRRRPACRPASRPRSGTRPAVVVLLVAVLRRGRGRRFAEELEVGLRRNRSRGWCTRPGGPRARGPHLGHELVRRRAGAVDVVDRASRSRLVVVGLVAEREVAALLSSCGSEARCPPPRRRLMKA